MSLRGFATVNIWADDVAAAAAWYADFLGTRPYFERPGPDGRPAYIEFRIGDSEDELGVIDSRYRPAGAATEPGGVVLHWHVDDLAATVERLLSLGATEYQPITPREAGFVTAAVVDPFGNVLGVMHNPHYLEILAATKPAYVDVLELPDAAGWESWLAAEHEARSEAWLRIAKRHSGIEVITISEALDVALCFGWIDGQRKGLDDVSFLQRYSRRRPRSSWSRVNVAKVEALTAAGRMRPAGIAEVEAARADGRWDAAYESQRTAAVPPDLVTALAADAIAAAAFERLGCSDRYAVILPLLRARTPETRARTLSRTIERLSARA